MSTTQNFNIVLPEGTDTFAPLTFNNNAFTLIDQIMKQNQDAGITTATAVLENDILTIVRSKPSVKFFAFVASADYAASNVVTVDGVQVSVRLADGTIPRNGAWVTNQLVLCAITGTIMNVISASAGVSPAAVGDLTNLETSDKSSIVNAINEVSEGVVELEAQKDVRTGSVIASSVQAGVFTNVASVTLPAGTWMLYGTADFASTTEAILSFAIEGSGLALGRSRSFSASSREIILSSATVITLQQSREVELRVESTVGTNVGSYLTAVRYQ